MRQKILKRDSLDFQKPRIREEGLPYQMRIHLWHGLREHCFLHVVLPAFQILKTFEGEEELPKEDSQQETKQQTQEYPCGA